ncbi:MAG: hypothetical protein GWP91_00195 [Rhodobacterales bacterium]|nr:hypothetical protein [Rhodobacterales bacterium]
MKAYCIPALLVLLGACEATTQPSEENEVELITTVVLDLTSQTTGESIPFAWVDLEGDGSPVVDPVVLALGDIYDVQVSFLNELENPVEDISVEVADEAAEHQVFFTGAGVFGPASDAAGALFVQAYDDADSDGNPLGLANIFEATSLGSSEFTVTLRHLPIQGDVAVKTSGLAAVVAADGFSGIGGDTDVDVTFPVTVEP